ncbi:ABC transporter substrate-binding protein [Aestuariimicrobium ganziense]|uniref:ABC transporter substrate-binding protein n=1 Tax=Aestuariimicrobium ganziense TaxID=2773677 RepID=UPI00194358C2|nr:sugar ABC transporter substrate-binding protein [Aestuariimicrobium ganziense]
MNLSRRHLFAAAGGIAAAATVSACGDNSGGVGTTTSPTAATSGSATGASSQASNVTLQQWYHEYGEAGVKEAVEKYAAEYTDAKVTVTWNPGDYGKKLSAALLTNDFPDVFEVEQGGSLDMIQAGQLAELNDIFDPVKDQFNPAVVKRFTYDGKIYGIPQVVDMQLLYYRKSALEKAGKQPPKTFAELVDVANAVATGDMGGFFAGNDGGLGVLGTMFIWASGHEQLDEGRTKGAFLTPEFYDAVKAYADFYKNGKGLLKSASKEWYDGTPFADGETAMQWGGLWSVTDIKAKLGDDFGVLPFPAMGAKGRPAVPFGAFGACVAAKGKNVEAAKAFVKWLWIDQEEKQIDFADSYGTHIPSKTALVPKATKLADGAGADAAKFVAESGFTNDIMWSGALGEAYGAALSNAITKGVDPAEAFKGFADKVAAELKRLKG